MLPVLLLLFPLTVSSELLADRELLTDFPAQKALLRVRYTLQNDFPEPIHNVTVLDPSFNRTNVKFEDGRRRAKVTFGTIKPGETPYVNLDMFPKFRGSLSLEPYTVSFHRNDGSPSVLEKEADGVFEVTSYREFVMREEGWMHAVYAILAVVPVGIAPLGLACYLKHQRRVIYKNLKGQ